MSVDTVSLLVRIPAPLRQQAQTVAKLRGETVSEVVRSALRNYIRETLDDERDNRTLDALVERIEAGIEPMHDHADVWAEIEALEAHGELPT